MEDRLMPVVINCAEHGNTVTNGLRRLFETKRGTDLEFRWNGMCVRAHKLVLELFLTQETLVQGCNDDQNDQVKLPGATVFLDDGHLPEVGQNVDSSKDFSILNLVFEFMYNGTVTLPSEQLAELLRVARELDFGMLVDVLESMFTLKTGRTTPQLEIAVPGVDRDDVDEETRPVTRSVLRRTARSLSGLRKQSESPPKSDHPIKKRSAADKEKRICGEELNNKAVTRVGACRPTLTTNSPPTKSPSPVSRKRKVGKLSKNERTVGGKPAVTRRHRQPLLKCTRCKYSSRDSTLLEVHKAKHHDFTENVFRCSVCSEIFLDQVSLDRHSTMHESSTKVDFAYSCPHCPHKSRQESWFRLHLKIDHGDTSVEVYCCNTCRCPFLTASAMSCHTCIGGSVARLHSCPHCKFKTSRRIILRRHLARHDPSAAASIFRCDMCSQAFLSPTALANHRSAHTTYRCPHCHYEARKSNLYYHHLYAKHRRNARGELVPERIKKYSCPDCAYRCVQLSELKIHRTAKHSPEMPFKCEQCSFASGRKGSVVRHVKWVHLGLRQEPIYMCDTCGHRCRTPCKLADHMRRHTDEKPHTCELCGKNFKDRHSHKRHQLRHVSDEKPFCCHICGFSCNRRDNLRGHLRRIHKVSLDSQPSI